MRIKFYGFKNIGWLERRRMRKILYRWVEDHLNAIISDVTRDYTLSRLKRFDIRFFPTTEYTKRNGTYNWRSADTGNLSDLIPHEIMGHFKIELFLLDNKDDMRFASNLIMMSHGLGHALLYCYDPNRRTVLKVDDASGNRKGKILSWHTAAVHNRTDKIEKTVQRLEDDTIDNQIYYLRTYRYLRRAWRKTLYRMYDFRDDLI